MDDKTVKADLMVVQLDRARTALAEAKTIGETKKIMDMAHAAQIYARRQQLGEEAMAYAHSIKYEALRKLGEMLASTPKAKPGTKPKFAPAGGANSPTLYELGISDNTSAIAQKLASLPKEAFEKVRDGAVAVKKALQAANVERKRAAISESIGNAKGAQLQKLEGVYDVIVIDPPWNYGRAYDAESSRSASPYPEMTQNELLAIELPAARDCVLFLWTTHAFIWDAKAIMDAAGFSYKATLVWNKQKIGMGAWLRMQCEFCLVGIKGKPLWENTTYRDIIEEARREHSRKPDGFYTMVEAITAGRRLDYFSRQERNGWDTYGNETSKF